MKADICAIIGDYIGYNMGLRLARLFATCDIISVITIYTCRSFAYNNNRYTIKRDSDMGGGTGLYTYTIISCDYMREYGYMWECQGFDRYMYEYKTRDKHLLLDFSKYGNDFDEFIYNGKKLNLEWDDVKSIANSIEGYIMARFNGAI